ncbi:V-type proton ATPase subunit S1 [Danaus plexippus]|uniref:Vacuolar ATP synthase subunit S1 n=1 Tax=Danaus plexippus plexippus TaxID=278856 RepID=A0A212ESJ8_DANPL|nr:V-type proton ATPase subunit S1 [Danaus plexippus]OWR44472.1 putative vacuolar ATP synthase subunit S1 [Danaus plexippus plexippus]
MAFCRLVFPILVLSVVSCFANLQVPVFLWGDLKTSIKSNPLVRVTESEFEDTLKQEIKDHFTVIFVDESLSVEDFSRKNDDGETSFPYLHANIGNSVYLPAVDNPIAALDNLADPEKVDRVKLTENGLSAEFEPESVKILFITLKDARVGESRTSLLRRHNDFMEEMFTKLQNQYGNVVAIYTADFPSWVVPESHSRLRRQAEPLALNQYSINGLKLYVQDLILSVNSEKTHLNTVSSQSSTFNGTDMLTTIGFGENTLTLSFSQKMGYWYFKTVTLEQKAPSQVTEILYPKEEVFSFMDMSYRCGQDVSFTSINDTNVYSVTFSNMKVQPFFKDTNSSIVFGDSVNCVGFFSVPIWSGLFVVFILLAITFYGILMMMDIRTMDRFDDPKGKTITINANE